MRGQDYNLKSCKTEHLFMIVDSKLIIYLCFYVLCQVEKLSFIESYANYAEKKIFNEFSKEHKPHYLIIINISHIFLWFNIIQIFVIFIPHPKKK